MRRAAVIMAGGSGTRLWPLSRRSRPKQLLHIVEGRSLIAHAYERLRGLFEPRDIYIITLAEHLAAIQLELPEIPAENLIGEPQGRDTANAVALSAAILHRLDADTTLGVFTADHHIRPQDRFVEVVRRGYAAVEAAPDALVTFGIRPKGPQTGLGYIERGDKKGEGIWSVKAFKEKPDAATARHYVESGNYDWNSGMFVWRTRTILDEIGKHLPQTHDAVTRIAGQWRTPQGAALARELYGGLQRISIDYAVMEKAAKVLVVEMDLDWQDVGSWTALPAVAKTDAAGNSTAASRVVTMDARGNILVSEDEHLIAAIGVEDLVVVHSPDATLVCRKDQVERLKELVAELEKRHPGRYG